MNKVKNSLPETNSSHLKIARLPPKKECSGVVLQPSIFRGKPFVSGRVNKFTLPRKYQPCPSFGLSVVISIAFSWTTEIHPAWET